MTYKEFDALKSYYGVSGDVMLYIEKDGVLYDVRSGLIWDKTHRRYEHASLDLTGGKLVCVVKTLEHRTANCYEHYVRIASFDENILNLPLEHTETGYTGFNGYEYTPCKPEFGFSNGVKIEYLYDSSD